MPILIEKLTQFLRWWKQGLLEPWRRWHPIARFVLSADQGKLTIVRLDAKGCAQHDPLPFSSWRASQRRLKHQLAQARIYLLIPREQVMATPVSVEQRQLHASDIAAETLPFEPHELVASLNAAQNYLYSVLLSDVQIVVRGAHLLLAERSSASMEWLFSGVAFATPNGWLTTDTELPATNDGTVEPVQQPMPKRSPIMQIANNGCTYCLLGLIVIWATALWAKHSALHEQEILQEQLMQRTMDSPESSEHPFAAIVTYARARSAQDTLQMLDALAMSLRADDVLSQLILTNDNLVLDASSSDASGLQLVLREVAAFDTVEFVAGITAQATSAARAVNPQERFRLKVVLPTAVSVNAEASEL